MPVRKLASNDELITRLRNNPIDPQNIVEVSKVAREFNTFPSTVIKVHRQLSEERAQKAFDKRTADSLAETQKWADDLAAAMQEIMEEEPTPANLTIEQNFEKGLAKVSVDNLSGPIKTKEELIRVCQIDTTEWTVVSYKSASKSLKGAEPSYSVIVELKKKELTIEEQQQRYFRELAQTLARVHKPTSIVYTPASEKALLVYLSDMHIGAKTLDDAMYGNHYDADEAEVRMRLVINGIMEQVALHGRFAKIYLLNLGDALDGMKKKTVRGGHDLPQNMGDEGQFDTFVSLHKLLIDDLVEQNVANSIEYIATYNDNHSHTFAYTALGAFREYLQVRHPHVKMTVSKTFFSHFTYGDHCFVYTHGKDHADMKHGMPLHLDPKTEVKINNYFRYNEIDQTFKHVVKGDLHQSATGYGADFRYKNVPSFYGASRWIQTNFGPGRAGVDYDIVEPYAQEVTSGQILF